MKFLTGRRVFLPLVGSLFSKFLSQSHVRRLVWYSEVEILFRDRSPTRTIHAIGLWKCCLCSVTNSSLQVQHHTMPKRRNKNSNHPKKVQKFAHEQQFEDVVYYFENGLRKIKPYVYKFECHAKGRWFGSKLLDVFKKEFRLESAEYYETAIREGLIRVNRGMASPDRILKNNDFMQSKVHRHEPPVSGEQIQIIAETEEYLVINKPASIPVHPCGKYRHNTIVFILGKEYGFKGLHTIHRLDRLTSGLLLFARTLEVSHRLDAYVRDRKLEKTYVCKVQGEFPSTPLDCEEPIFIVSHKIGVCRVREDGKPCKTRFERLSYDGETSIVKCYPHTGRMHQIRVHLQYLGYPIVNDPLYNNTVWGQEKGKGGNKELSDEQLLKDLIEQHDIEIDSALEKARLQTLMNKPNTSGETRSEPSNSTQCSQQSSKAPFMSSNDAGTSCNSIRSNGESDLGEMSIASITNCAGTDGLGQAAAVQDKIDGHSRIESRECSPMDDPSSTLSSSADISEQLTKACPSDQDHKVNGGSDCKAINNSDVTDSNTLGNSEVADPTQGKTRTSKELCRRMSSEHGDAVKEDIDVDDALMTAQDVKNTEMKTSFHDGNTNDDEILIDEKTDKLAVALCRECREPMPDPEPNEMCIYLHALSYKGPDFEFSVPMPAWAQEHFQRTGTKYL